MDKKEYWKKRSEGKRGQGDYPAHKFYGKGEVVKYLRRKDDKLEEDDYPNDVGHHGYFQNRKDYRRKAPSDAKYTKKRR